MLRHRYWIAALGVTFVSGLACGRALAAWSVGLAGGSSGLAAATGAPGRPQGVTAVCTAKPFTVDVSWSAVSRATSYSVWEAAGSAGGPYTQVQSGVSATSSNLVLAGGATYWFEVQAVTDGWSGPLSAATPAGRAIALPTGACS